MCLAIPGKIIKIFKDNTAEIEIGGIVKLIRLQLVVEYFKINILLKK